MASAWSPLGSGGRGRWSTRRGPRLPTTRRSAHCAAWVRSPSWPCRSTAGLSAPVITELTETWKVEQRAYAARDLSEVDYVYLWADGIVRHEAPQDRVEVRDLHRRAVVAAR